MSKKLTQYLVKKFIANPANIRDDEVRARYGLFEGWLSVVINTALFVLKFGLGLLINSLALIADSIHTLADTLTSVIVIVGFKISRKPADAQHPYGHGRAEYIATLMISVLLIVTGIEFFRSGIERLMSPEAYTFIDWWIVVIISVTAVIKEVLARISFYMGKMIDSDALIADFWHHRTDAIASIFVVIAMITVPLGYPWVDAVAALIVACFIVFTGGQIAWGAIDTLMGKPPTEEFIQDIKKELKTLPNVLNTHDIVVHTYGQKIFMSLHIEVSDTLSPMQSHDLAEAVERHLHKQFGAFSTIHIDPVQVDNKTVNAIKAHLNKILDTHEGFLSFHDLRIVDGHHERFILFDMATSINPQGKEARALKDDVIGHIKSEFPDITPKIYITPMHNK
ncbi:MAG: cation transporter [Deltaproteobacteria bacterium]|nr:cation transporter [Deltaproteobacteria bacterium]